MLACDSGLVLAKYCHHTFICRSQALYLLGQNIEKVFLINSELNLYLVSTQDELKIWNQNRKKYETYDFGQKIEIKTAKVVENGRNSVVYIGTEKNLLAL